VFGTPLSWPGIRFLVCSDLLGLHGFLLRIEHDMNEPVMLGTGVSFWFAC
jgi:hypothetical protein